MKERDFQAEIDLLKNRLETLEERKGIGKRFSRLLHNKLSISLGIFLLISSGIFLFAEDPAQAVKFKDGQILSGKSLNNMHERINELMKTQTPVSGIIAWHRDFAGGNPQLPSGFVECNGQLIQMEGSTYDGKHAPNLNGVSEVGHENSPDLGAPERLFLRGGTTSGLGETDAIQAHGHSNAAHDHANSISGKFGSRGTSGCFPSCGNPPELIQVSLDVNASYSPVPSSLQITANSKSITITDPIQTGTATLNVAEETRPKSMSVIYIIRVK